MITYEKIDPTTVLSLEEFLILFSKLPLLEEEKRTLPEYYEMYSTFLNADVNPADAWVATRNVFIVKNMQIGERLKVTA